jgi:hypothetical protein
MRCHQTIAFATRLPTGISTHLSLQAAHSSDPSAHQPPYTQKNRRVVCPPAAAATAERFEGDDAAANSFGHRTLYEDEGRALYRAGYMAPPDMRAPSGWRMSGGGILIQPEPCGNVCTQAVH